MDRSNPDMMENVKTRAADTYEDAKQVTGQKYEQAKEYAGEKYEQAKDYAGQKYEDMRDRANAKIENDIKPSLGMGPEKETEAPIEPQGMDPEIDNLVTAEVIQNIAEEEQSVGARASNAIREGADYAADKAKDGVNYVRGRLNQ